MASRLGSVSPASQRKVQEGAGGEEGASAGREELFCLYLVLGGFFEK